MGWTNLVCAGLLLAGQAAPAETVFDRKAVDAPPLNGRVLKRSEKAGIVTEEVMFHAETDGGKAVEIFALFAYPKGAKKLPAFVWNQGGLYQATPHFPELGAKRGYAAICIDFPIPGYRSTGGYPINSGLELPADAKTAPIYHGAVALLRAVSYLQSRPEVDPDRIGMAGSSWGGFYTTLMTGLDPRLKAGSSMFGCGALDLGNAWWDGQGRDAKRDPAFRQRWRATLDPAPRLRTAKTPMAWFTGTNDSFYWMPGLMESYRGAAGPKHLSLLPNWNHALTPTLDDQVFAWLDVHLKGAPRFLAVDELAVKDGVVRWRFRGAREARTAELIVSFGEAGNWVSRHWLRVPATIVGDTCTAQVPAAPVACFVAGNLHDGQGYLTSTPLCRLDADSDVQQLPDYDGCSMWGGFEPAQLDFLKLHGLPVPALTTDAKQGTSAARVQGKPASFGPIHYTAGFKHELRAWLKADRPGDVTLALVGVFDGKPQKAELKIAATTAWQEVRIAFAPPASLTGQLQAVVTVPPGLAATIDAVSFRPVRPRPV